MTKTQVGIVGAGPAGLTLARLLELEGVETIVLESRDREYCEQRIRAGVLEQRSAELLLNAGVGERMDSEGIVHRGINLQFDGGRHYVPMADLTGRTIVLYGQTEVVKDLIAARVESGLPLQFECEVQSVDPDRGIVHHAEGALECDLVAGCDGFHGVCRQSIPADKLTVVEREYPFGWLGILASVAPSTDELLYAHHERGFALLSLRSPQLSRYYLQVAHDENIAEWPDERIWEELQTRTALDGWTLHEGPIVEKGVTGMRSFVASPMQHGRLYLAGDAAHIVPPTGAKGLNLAVADVAVLARALAAYFEAGRTDLLKAYSATCLDRVWKVQRFSWWMTSMLHRFGSHSPFERRVQAAELAYVAGSEAASRALAENYVGLKLATDLL
jgi:p-hydroxybenzoate 3-monooxygenase